MTGTKKMLSWLEGVPGRTTVMLVLWLGSRSIGDLVNDETAGPVGLQNGHEPDGRGIAR